MKSDKSRQALCFDDQLTQRTKNYGTFIPALALNLLHWEQLII